MIEFQVKENKVLGAYEWSLVEIEENKPPVILGRSAKNFDNKSDAVQEVQRIEAHLKNQQLKIF